MTYCINTKDLGIELKGSKPWDGRKGTKLKVGGHGDSATAKCLETKRSITGTMTTLNGSPVITRSVMQTTIKLSVIELKLDSTVSMAQDMIL